MEKTNFIRVEGRAIIVARNKVKYIDLLEKAKQAVDDSNPTWADNGVSNEELAAMAGGNHNVIVIADIDTSIDAKAVTYEPDGTQFDFGVTKFLNMGFIAATKDGRPFTDEERQKLIRAGEGHIRDNAEDMGALYLILPPQNGNAETRIQHLAYSAAETCEATREELVAVAAECRKKALENLLGMFDHSPEE